MAAADRASGAYMSLAEAGRLIGMQGTAEAIAKRLRRILTAKERETRKVIMLRAGGPKQPRYLVTRHMLLRRLPEMFSPVSLMTEAVREEMDKLVEEFRVERAYDRETVEHLGEKIHVLERLLRSAASRHKSPEAGQKTG